MSSSASISTPGARPLVSVITATYNAMPHLATCVDSVKCQQTDGLFDIEHVFVDGGSTDGTVAYIQKLIREGYRARYVSEPDQGIYDAMNKGARMAEGCIFNFLNADDKFADARSTYVSVLPLLDGKADFSYGTAKLYDREGTCRRTIQPVLNIPYINQPFSHQTLFVRTDAFNAVGGHDLRFNIVADTHMIWKLKSAGFAGADVDKLTIVGLVGGASFTQYSLHEMAQMALENSGKIDSLMSADASYAARFAVFAYIHGRAFPAWAPEGDRKLAAGQRIELINKLGCRCACVDRLCLQYLKWSMLRPAEKGMPIGRCSWRFATTTALMRLMLAAYRVRFGQKLAF